MVIRTITRRQSRRTVPLERLPLACAKMGHEVLHNIVAWVRSGARGLWNAVAPADQAMVAVSAVVDVVRSRRDLVLEKRLLRHQIGVLRRKSPRPRLTRLDRLRLIVVAAVLPQWRRALAIVQPHTILRWHRAGFRLFWRRRSRTIEKQRMAPETVSLIRKMATENRLWGAERIRGELLKLGIRASKRTVQKYMRSLRPHRGGQAGQPGRRSSRITLATSGAVTSCRPTTCSSARCSSSSW